MYKNKFINKNSILLTILLTLMFNIPWIILRKYNFNLINTVIIVMFVAIFTILFISFIAGWGLTRTEAATDSAAPTILVNFIKIYNKSMELITGSDSFKGINTDDKYKVYFYTIAIIIYPIVFIIMLILFSIKDAKKNNLQVYTSNNTKLKTNYHIKFTNVQNIILIIISFVILLLFFKLLLTSLVNNVTLSVVNKNFSLYLNTFLITFFVYVSFYCYFVDNQNQKKIDEINKKI